MLSSSGDLPCLITVLKPMNAMKMDARTVTVMSVMVEVVAIRFGKNFSSFDAYGNAMSLRISSRSCVMARRDNLQCRDEQ